MNAVNKCESEYPSLYCLNWKVIKDSKYYEGDQAKEDKIGRACSTHVSWEIITKFWLESLNGRDHLEDLGIVRRMVLEFILGK
jgi:hypothetical protein